MNEEDFTRMTLRTYKEPEGIIMKDDGAKSQQHGGRHYVKHSIQPWDIIDEYDLSFYEGNALKYLLRRKDNRLLDLKKAKHYIEKCIEKEAL
jgi:hypothetical protein